MSDKSIEVEVRSFISPEQYAQLIAFFTEHGELVCEDTQETHYFDCEEDLRIQKSDSYSKIWMKKGNLHDDHREEIEVKCPKESFTDLGKLFSALGMGVEIKWFRTRHSFKWENIDVAVDFTKGYGHILELEKMSSEQDKDVVLADLKSKLEKLGIPLTPKIEFKEKYEFYKDNWNELV